MTSIVSSTDLQKKKVSWFDMHIEDFTKDSVTKQVAVGGISGWCAGILFTRVGKTAASALAGGVFLFQIARQQGYININWSKVRKDIEKAKRDIKKTKKGLPGLIQEIQLFGQDNKFLVTSFAGGFLLGLATF